MLRFHLWPEIHLYSIKCWMNVCKTYCAITEAQSLQAVYTISGKGFILLL